MSRLTRFAAAWSLALVVLPSAALAQTCLGAASFRSSPYRLGANASVADGGKMYGGQFAYGHSKGAFGSVSLSVVDADEVPDNETALGVGVGYSAPFGLTKQAELCPIFSIDFQSGPDIDAGGVTVESGARTFALGVGVGRSVPSTPAWDVIPFASAVYTNATITLKGTALGQQFDVGVTDEYLALSVGAGFVTKKVLTIRPSIMYPLGVEETADQRDLIFNILLAYNFGSSGTKSSLRR